jgi:hypothetical protein
LEYVTGVGQGLNRRPCPAPHPGSLCCFLNISEKGHFYCGEIGDISNVV